MHAHAVFAFGHMTLVNGFAVVVRLTFVFAAQIGRARRINAVPRAIDFVTPRFVHHVVVIAGAVG